MTEQDRKVYFNYQVNEMMEKALPAKGYVFYDQELVDKVKAELEKKPHDFLLNFKLGILYHDKEPLLGIECLSKCLAVRPFHDATWFNRSRKYLTLHRWHEALADLNMAIAINDEVGYYYHYKGVALFFLERFEECARTFEQSIRVMKATTMELLSCETDWLWMTYIRLGEYAKARKLLEDFDVNTPIIPITGADYGYNRRVLLLKGAMSEEEYVSKINPFVENEGGAVNDWHALARYYYHIKKDAKKALEILDEVERPREGNYTWSWGYRYAKFDRPHWTENPVSPY